MIGGIAAKMCIRDRALVSFAPISAVCGAFTEKCRGDVALSSAVNSLYIIVSLIAMTVLLLVLL